MKSAIILIISAFTITGFTSTKQNSTVFDNSTTASIHKNYPGKDKKPKGEKDVKWLSFEEAQKLAAKTPKKIFVDVYTDWCGWCKKMDKNTLSDPGIKDYLNKKYYAVKLNAVLVGDFLLSRGMLLAIENEDFTFLKIVSNAVKEMSEGELLQIEKARNLDISETVYFEIIRQKTASLISSCCGVGAASVKASPEVIEKAQLFGEKVGIAFQIKDDLFDYNTDKTIGKPVGIDIKERKLTLPLIHALNKAGWNEKRNIINIVKNENHKPKKVSEVIEFVKAKGGIEYATRAMENYQKEAFDILDTFPDSTYKTSLKQLVDYTIERKK